MNITDPYPLHASRQPDRPAIITEDETILYRDWESMVRLTAAAFSQEPATHHRVAIFLPNGHLFLQVFAGACAAGWASIVGDMRWKQGEIDERLRQTQPDIIIADESIKDSFHTHSIKVIFSEEIKDWIRHRNEWHADHPSNPPFYIGFTSGSTGQPKAFIRSHQSWVESFRCNQEDLGLAESDHVLIPGSFVNSTFLYGALSTLYIGGTVYLLKKFAPGRLIQAFHQYPISVVYTVPTMIQALLDEDWKEDQEVTFISTGAKLLSSVKKTMKRNFPHASLFEFYGASELSFVTVLKENEQTAHGDSVGRPVHNVDMVIRREDGREARPNEAGILYVKSPMLFDGYLNDKEENQNAWDGEWATVHDLVKKDKNGFVYVIGRKNDMILYGGINIYPQEIEKVLKKMDNVEEAVVCGVNDPYWGEKIAACIKGDVSITALKSHCLKQLTPYKIPRIWKKVTHFPYTSGGKIARKEVRKWLEVEQV
ncbi:acyl-CoA synthetase [Thalassobacillus devorans]|uniref:Acyl-CoA synthetase n=1 Tax=Thalassobacillus devorans TaxID=279813 RepID=A0ABQ1NIK9_9BACI|nr:AMP-binding protein [Thalassobacillus devorans]NIK27484.1 long-chain acyl-CoA synthetase [Thalassobacillus devorans]GGC78063.1 acyl-CoA synthetase [Thalassobacillus devorans]